MPPTPLVIGLAGGTGSGKTTVANVILKRVGSERIAYVPHDAYYRKFSDLPSAQRETINWGHPDSQAIIVVEGILIFADARLRQLFDMKIFVDTDADLRFIRRLQRDIAERGRTVASVVDQYLATARPMHLEFVEPSKRYADIIMPEGGRNEVAMERIVARLERLLPAPV